MVATSTAAASESTSIGRELHRLTVWMGHLYAAYGDYGANTGPVDVISLDLADTAAGFMSEATLHTEETWFFRIANDGKLYVAFIDAQGYEDGTQGQYAVASTPGSWTIVTDVTPVPIHVMGLCETADGIFLFGAANEPDPPNGGATVWRSTDNGATWSLSLAPRPDPTNFARFYTPMLYGDVIEVLYDDGAPSHNALYHWDGAVWSVVTDQAPGHPISDAIPFTYQGTAFHLCIDHGKAWARVADSAWHIRTLAADDGDRAAITASIPATLIRDACTDGTHLWVLDSNGTIFKGATDGTWVTLCTLDIIPSSIAVDGSTLYLGTPDSAVYSTDS